MAARRHLTLEEISAWFDGEVELDGTEHRHLRECAECGAVLDGHSRLRRLARKAIPRAKELLARVGIPEKANERPSRLSGGQQQRVAIARALINDPAIILADEPTGNLDSRTSREVIELFRKLNEDNAITVILVTHDPDVARHAKRIIALRDGRVVEDTPDVARAWASLHTAEPVEPAESADAATSTLPAESGKLD
mgnify:CR=1 FL=1